MSLVVGTIQNGALAGTNVNIEVPTVRVPELPDATLPLQDTDLMVIYQEGGNKTTKADIAIIRDYIVTGGNPAAITPIINGADVEIKITAGMADKSRVNVPILANKMFRLKRRGFDQLLVEEYDIIPSGGFELNPKDANGKVVDDNDPNAIPQLVHDGEVFIATVFDWEVGAGGGNNPGGTTSLFDGLISLNTTTQLSTMHRNKLLQVAGGANSLVITLEDIADSPANSIVCITTVISNTKQNKVAAKAGQKIYYNNTSNDYIWLGISEVLWMYRGDDGWYVIGQLQGVDNVGDEEWGRKQKTNMLVAKGQEVLRADYPRLWEWVQSLGNALVDDATWHSSVSIPNAATGTRTNYNPYHGCYSYGSGGLTGTTFRLPDFQEKSIRGLNNAGSSDSQRSFNNPGGTQYDTNRAHGHTWKNSQGVRIDTNDGRDAYVYTDVITNRGKNLVTLNTDVLTVSGGGFESRPYNIGMLRLIRV